MANVPGYLQYRPDLVAGLEARMLLAYTTDEAGVQQLLPSYFHVEGQESDPEPYPHLHDVPIKLFPYGQNRCTPIDELPDDFVEVRGLVMMRMGGMWVAGIGQGQ